MSSLSERVHSGTLEQWHNGVVIHRCVTVTCCAAIGGCCWLLAAAADAGIQCGGGLEHDAATVVVVAIAFLLVYYLFRFFALVWVPLLYDNNDDSCHDEKVSIV